MSVQHLTAREPSDDQGWNDWPLAGREMELSRMAAAVVSGQGAVLTGPAGMGKTILAMTSLRAAKERDMAFVRTAATRTMRGLPFGTLAHP